MAVKSLSPGFADVESQTLVATGDTHTFDVSKCTGGFAIQAGAQDAGTSTVQVKHTFDGTNFPNLGGSVVMAVGDILRFPAEDGPYGKVKLTCTMGGGQASAVFSFIGFMKN